MHCHGSTPAGGVDKTDARSELQFTTVGMRTTFAKTEQCEIEWKLFSVPVINLYIVIFLKLWSYAAVNYWCRVDAFACSPLAGKSRVIKSRRHSNRGSGAIDAKSRSTTSRNKAGKRLRAVSTVMAPVQLSPSVPVNSPPSSQSLNDEMCCVQHRLTTRSVTKSVFSEDSMNRLGESAESPDCSQGQPFTLGPDDDLQDPVGCNAMESDNITRHDKDQCSQVALDPEKTLRKRHQGAMSPANSSQLQKSLCKI
ncbi:unnamed protein product [Protopolystoma xenopodis]|uniref:Uncharacterized protein n=1 Tax=Protopolystoma xenopodis TaxID=117903 RepID=A0A448WXN8_9PLAT|nr:unnamed protein product [Protopolystoma xenopodis]